MRRVLKWIGIVLGGLLVIGLIAGAEVYFLSEGRLNATFTVPADSMSFHNDIEIVAESERLATISWLHGLPRRKPGWKSRYR